MMGEHVKTAAFAVAGIIGVLLCIWLFWWGLYLYFSKLPWPCPEWRCPVVEAQP